MPGFQFVGGKGGVGKTTCAAMFALEAAARGRTLLVSTDPASSLSTVLGTLIEGETAPIAGAAGLFAANVDSSKAFERWLAPRKQLLATIAVRGTYLDEEDVGRLLKLSLPGIDEVIGLMEIVRMSHAAAQPYETIVVDTAPTGHTLRLLAAPALLGKVAGLLNSLQAHHRAVVSALRGAYRSDAADSLIVELDREGDELAAMLRNRKTTEISWVTLPEPMALEETADAIGALERNDIRVDRLIVNRMTPAPDEACPWCEARRRFEARALAPVARRFAGRQILSLPELPREPRGVSALRSAIGSLVVWTPPPHSSPPASRVRATADIPARVLPSTGASYVTSRSEETKLLLFGGKGGVGKSTCAAATALRVAEKRRVLLVSTDPAHSLGDVLGARFGNDPRAVRGSPRLHVREIDAAAEMDKFRAKYVAAVDDAFGRIARTAAGDQEAFRELIDLAPPGIDEVIAIADVAEAITAAKDGPDVVIVDTAPTGHALRLLQTPGVLRDWTLALMAILVKYREIVGAGTLAALLVQLSKRLRGLQDILADPAACGFIVVTRAAGVPIDESHALMDALARMSIAVTAVIVNAVGAGSCSRCRAVRRAQAAAMKRLRRGDYAIIVAPADVPPPHGPAGLREWVLSWQQLT